VFPAVPLHVEYSLTGLGESLVAPLAALRAWAEEHLDDIAQPQPAEHSAVATGPVPFGVAVGGEHRGNRRRLHAAHRQRRGGRLGAG
jgi:hypothetical protein